MKVSFIEFLNFGVLNKFVSTSSPSNFSLFILHFPIFSNFISFVSWSDIVVLSLNFLLKISDLNTYKFAKESFLSLYSFFIFSATPFDMNAMQHKYVPILPDKTMAKKTPNIIHLEVSELFILIAKRLIV